MEKFKLQVPPPDKLPTKQGVIRVKPAYYQMLAVLHIKTGLPLGNIVEQCIDYALTNMEDTANANP